MTAELTCGLILASLRHLPLEVERLKQGHWHTTVGTRLYGNTWVSTHSATSGERWRGSDGRSG